MYNERWLIIAWIHIDVLSTHLRLHCNLIRIFIFCMTRAAERFQVTDKSLDPMNIEMRYASLLVAPETAKQY